jgi:hypothetical protein
VRPRQPLRLDSRQLRLTPPLFAVHRGSLAAAAARPPALARWQGSRAGARCHARGFAAAAGGEEPPGSGDDSSSEWLDSSDEEEGEESGSDEDDDEEEGDEAEAGDDGERRPKAKTKLSADELARMELEDPLACACPRAASAPPTRANTCPRAQTRLR